MVQIQFRELLYNPVSIDPKVQIQFDALKKRINVKKTYYVCVNSTSNNSIFSIVNESGEVLVWRSCGWYFRGKDRSTEVAHIDTTKKLSFIASLLGIKNLIILFKGNSSWHISIVNELFDYTREITEDSNLKNKKKWFIFNLLGLKDITNIPFNGCRRWKYNLKNKKRKQLSTD